MPPRNAIAISWDNGSVERLLGVRYPSTIVGVIAMVIVFSFYGQVVIIAISHRPFTEYAKIIPLVTNNDPAPAIMPMPRIVLVVASAPHGFPRVIKSSALSAMFGKPVFCQFWKAMAARLNFSFAQIRPRWSCNFSTRAATFPYCSTTASVPGLFKHNKLSETASGHINKSGIFCHVR